jgi:hypothetical protein
LHITLHLSLLGTPMNEKLRPNMGMDTKTDVTSSEYIIHKPSYKHTMEFTNYPCECQFRYLTKDSTKDDMELPHVVKHISREVMSDERNCTSCSKEVEYKVFTSHPHYFHYWKYTRTQLIQLFIAL